MERREAARERRQKGQDNTMLRAMDSAVAGLRAHQNRLDVIGNNIANVNTQGFKSQNYTFKDAMYQTSTTSTGGSQTNIDGQAANIGGTNPAQFGYGSLQGSISTDFTAGTPSYVGGLNASINGEGFFITAQSTRPADLTDTAVLYTRVGQFSVDSQGYLVDANSNYVLGSQRANNGGVSIASTTYRQANGGNALAGLVPIQLNDPNGIGFQSVSIDNNGTITYVMNDGTEGTTPFKVALARFENPKGLTKAGNNTYNHTSTDNAGSVTVSEFGGTNPTLMSGYLEGSNVDLAKEFSDMITTERGFQANAKIITVSDEVLNELVNMKR